MRLAEIPGFEGYLASHDGRVFSTRNRWGRTPPRELQSRLNSRGYPAYCIRVDGVNRTLQAHRAVATAFLGPRPDGMQINHIDGNKTNNSASNLEYVTGAENMRHARALGLFRRGARRVAP